MLVCVEEVEVDQTTHVGMLVFVGAAEAMDQTIHVGVCGSSRS